MGVGFVSPHTTRYRAMGGFSHPRFRDLKMPRPRTPTAILEATGQLAHDPKRYATRLTEPKPNTSLGTAPKHLTTAQKKVWKELSSTAPDGVLTGCDRWIVETSVILMSKIRTGNFTSTDIGHLRSCLAAMGMTPADRSRVSATPNAISDDLDELGFLM
jgi:hypothetical protein